MVTSSWKVVFILAQTCMVNSICQPPWNMYVQRGPYLNCRRIFNCGPGREILPCENNCDPERCVPCTDGKTQPNLIHSDSTDEDRRCFTPEPKQCGNRDVVAIRSGHNSEACYATKFCRCDYTNCFYGSNACVCRKQWTACGINHTLNSDGQCVPCPVGFYKPNNGCHSCYKIDPYKASYNTPPATTKRPIPRTSTASPTSTASQRLASNKSQGTSYDISSQSKVVVMTDKASSVGVTVSSARKSLSQRESSTEGAESNPTVPIVIVAVFILIIIIVITLIIYLRRKRLHEFTDKLCGRSEDKDENPAPIPEIQVNGTLINNECETVGENQEEVVESSEVETTIPLLPDTASTDVEIDGGTTNRVVTIPQTDHGSGKPSLESQSSGISSQSATISESVSTPVLETGPSPAAHPLEIYRSISSETSPFLTEIILSHMSKSTDDVSLNADPQQQDSYVMCNNDESSTTPAPNSISSSCPSPIVSDSIQTVDTNDHRISIVGLGMCSFDEPKVPAQSFQTDSFCSDHADNTHNLCSLRPSENEDDTLLNKDEKSLHRGERSDISTDNDSLQQSSTSCKETLCSNSEDILSKYNDKNGN